MLRQVFLIVRVVSCFEWPQDVLVHFGWIRLSALGFN